MIPSHVLTEANNNAYEMLMNMAAPLDAGTVKTQPIVPLPSLRDCSVRLLFC